MTRSPLRPPFWWPALAPCLALSGCALVAYPEIEGADSEPRDAAADVGPSLDVSPDVGPSPDGGSDAAVDLGADSPFLREIPRSSGLLYNPDAACLDNQKRFDWGPYPASEVAPECKVKWLDDGREGYTLFHVCCIVTDANVYSLPNRIDRDPTYIDEDDSIGLVLADRADPDEVTWVTFVQVNSAGDFYDGLFMRPPGSTQRFNGGSLDKSFDFTYAAARVTNSREKYVVEWIQELPARVEPGSVLWCALTRYDFQNSDRIPQRRAIVGGSEDILDPSTWTPCRLVE